MVVLNIGHIHAQGVKERSKTVKECQRAPFFDSARAKNGSPLLSFPVTTTSRQAPERLRTLRASAPVNLTSRSGIPSSSTSPAEPMAPPDEIKPFSRTVVMSMSSSGRPAGSSIWVVSHSPGFGHARPYGVDRQFSPDPAPRLHEGKAVPGLAGQLISRVAKAIPVLVTDGMIGPEVSSGRLPHIPELESRLPGRLQLDLIAVPNEIVMIKAVFSEPSPMKVDVDAGAVLDQDILLDRIAAGDIVDRDPGPKVGMNEVVADGAVVAGVDEEPVRSVVMDPVPLHEDVPAPGGPKPRAVSEDFAVPDDASQELMDVHAVSAVIRDDAALDQMIAARLGRMDAVAGVMGHRSVRERYPSNVRARGDLDPVRAAGHGDPGDADIAGRDLNDGTDASAEDLRCLPPFTP